MTNMTDKVYISAQDEPIKVSTYTELLIKAYEQFELVMLNDDDQLIPTKAYWDDAGYDLRANLNKVLPESVSHLIKIYEQTSTNPFHGLLLNLANLLRLPTERVSLPSIYIDGELFWQPGQNFNKDKLVAKLNKPCLVLWPKAPRTLAKYFVLPESGQTQALVSTGVSVTLPELPHPLLSLIRIVPRSGLASKHGLAVTNSPGTADQGYQDEIGVSLENRGEHVHIITYGTRIAQMTFDVCINLGKDLSQYKVKKFSKVRERGLAGFGSSGVK